ncbi:MAG: GNAT family N-acetyltransferase [Armatimonadetes bacterium]|nr:GNAT family N-acetyltransferase [Armatimonadota bacterium]
MYTRFADLQLPSGETAEIGLIRCPDPGDPMHVRELLAHKGGDWNWHIDRALAEELDGLETRYYVAVIDGQAVSNVMLCESAGVGILGHVFTRPEHRRKHLCQSIFDHLMPEFRARGGLRLALGTGYDSHPFWIYHRNGFRAVMPNSGMMTYEAVDGWAEQWYAPGPATVEPYDWKHWGPLCQLTVDNFGEGLQSLSLGGFGRASFEGSGISVVKAAQEGKLHARVLVRPTGAAMGLALLTPDRRWPGKWLLDLIAHPNYHDRLAELVAALPVPGGKTLAAVPTIAAARRAALEANGFEQEGTLRAQLPDGGDVALYGRV